MRLSYARKLNRLRQRFGEQLERLRVDDLEGGPQWAGQNRPRRRAGCMAGKGSDGDVGRAEGDVECGAVGHVELESSQIEPALPR